MYKISFINHDGDEFMGTIEHFTTDGRYSYSTIDEIARDIASKSLRRTDIGGYIIRKGRFSSPELRRVVFMKGVTL